MPCCSQLRMRSISAQRGQMAPAIKRFWTAMMAPVGPRLVEAGAWAEKAGSGSGRTDAAVAQQGLDAGLAAAEGAEQLRGIPGAALLEDLSAEAPARLRVEDTRFLEGAPGIGGEHLGPLVAVVARRIAAGEDMAEAVLEAVEGGAGHHRDGVAHLVEQRLDLAGRGGHELVVQAQVEDRELQLAHHAHGGLEVPGRLQLGKQLGGQRLAAVDVAGDQVEALALPAVVLHELAGQLRSEERR